MDTFLNSYVPTYNDTDSDLYLKSGAKASAGFTPTDSTHLVTKAYADSGLTGYVEISGDTMTGALGVITGSPTAPGIFFSGDLDTGIYSTGSDAFNITVGGTLMVAISGVTVNFQLNDVIAGEFRTENGSATDPAYSFRSTGNDDTGMYLGSAGNLAFSVDGVIELNLNATELNAQGNTIKTTGGVEADEFRAVTVGTAGDPSFTWTGDPNTGMYNIAADIIGWSAGGVEQMRLNVTDLVLTDVGLELSTHAITGVTSITFTGLASGGEYDADAGGPTDAAYYAGGDADTGMYDESANIIGLSAGGSTEMNISGSAITIFDNVQASADGAHSCGTSSFRWADVWAVDGTINTSDLDDKQNIAPIDNAANIIKSVSPIKYVWKQTADSEIQRSAAAQLELLMADKDYSELSDAEKILHAQLVADKSAMRPGVKTHYGFSGQEMATILPNTGASVIVDNKYAIRPTELVPILWQALREAFARIEALEAK